MVGEGCNGEAHGAGLGMGMNPKSVVHRRFAASGAGKGQGEEEDMLRGFVSRKGRRKQFRVSPATWIRLLLVLVCLESMYILSKTFYESLICDDLRLSLKLTRSDLERSQLVIRTLTLSCNESLHDECIKEKQALKQRHYEFKRSSARRNNSLRIELDQCAERLKNMSIEHSHHVLPMPPLPVLASGVEPAGGSGATDDPKPWLVIGIPTVERRSVEYLSTTLDALVAQLPTMASDPLVNRIRIVVMNNNPGTHKAFSDNRKRLEEGPWADIFDFVDNVERRTETPVKAYEVAREFRDRFDREKISKDDATADGESQKPEAKAGPSRFESNGIKPRKDRPDVARPPRPPDARVQQQTRDVSSLARYVSNVYNPNFYLFMEDDFLMCSNGVDAARYLIERATQYNKDWTAIRASFGLNGIFLHGKDLGPLADYLDKHQARRPPDHLVTEWFAGETQEARHYRGKRTNVGFRFNMFEHIGQVSTLRKAGHRTKFPGCWEPLEPSIVFPVESFKKDECPDNDVWPCYWKSECDPAIEFCLDGKVNAPPAPRIPWEQLAIKKE